MKTFAITMEDGPIGEAVEFSDGQVVVRWLSAPTISRFAGIGMLRGAMAATATFEPVRPAPLAQRLRQARLDAGLSQRALSREIGVPFSTLSRIESGRNYVSNPVIEDWLEAQ